MIPNEKKDINHLTKDKIIGPFASMINWETYNRLLPLIDFDRVCNDFVKNGLVFCSILHLQCRLFD